MSKFVGCTAVGNGLGGFFSANPTSEFIDCHASGNHGPGFIDIGSDLQHLQTAIQGISDARVRNELLQALRDVSVAEDHKQQLSAYERYVALAANYTTILSPFLPAVAALAGVV